MTINLVSGLLRGLRYFVVIMATYSTLILFFREVASKYKDIANMRALQSLLMRQNPA